MLGINAQTGQPLSGIDHLRQSIGDILTTRIGTRVMRRDYGSRLPELTDNPMTPRLAMEVYVATAEALARWEPRFKLTRVRMARASVGQMVLDLEGVYLPAGDAITLNEIGIVPIAAVPVKLAPSMPKPFSQLPSSGHESVSEQVLQSANPLLSYIDKISVSDEISENSLNSQIIDLNRKIVLIAKALGAK